MYFILIFSLVLFGVFLALDLPAVEKYPLVRNIMMVIALASLIAVYVVAVQLGDPVVWPGWSTQLGWVLTIMGGPLMTYSILIEIPLHLARRTASVSMTPAQVSGIRVVRTGTYALCRHPGFLWMLLFLTGQVLLAQRTGMLELVFCWVFLDLLVIAIQDYFIFPRRFADYQDYQLTTPFLVPTITSLKVAIQTIKGETYEHLLNQNE